MNKDYSNSPNHAQLSAYLDQGKLIEFYDFGKDIRVGIQSLTIKNIEDIALYFKGQPTPEVYQDAEAPVVFASYFLYSVNEKVLTPEEREELSQSLPHTFVQALFKKWRDLQTKTEGFNQFLESYIKTPDSKLKYKLCKLFKTTPSDPFIRDMDPITQNWFYHSIIEEEKEFLNEVYDKIEYAVGFFNYEGATKARRRRLSKQGIKSADDDYKESSNFDQELLNELREAYPDVDLSHIRTLDDYMQFMQENQMDVLDPTNSPNVIQYSEEDKANLIETLGREKGSPLTESEKEITIYKLDNGLPVNLQEIIKEAIDLDAVGLNSAQEILKDFMLDD